MARRGRRRRSRRRTSARRAPTRRRKITGRVSRSTQNKANKKTSPKKSAPKARRQRQTSPKRKAAPSPKKRTTTTTTKNKRGSGISQKRKDIGRNVGTTIKKTVGRITRPPSASAKTTTSTRSAFNKQLKNIQAANKPLGNPNVMSPDGTFNRPGPGGPEKEADYTSYKPGSFYNLSDTNMNPTNFLRSTRNVITTPARMLGINNQFTNKLIPKSNEAIQDARDQRGPRPTLTRPKSRGGSSRIEQQAAAQAVQPEIAPTIGTPPPEEYDFGPSPDGDLTRIQSQAYNEQLSNLMIGGTGSAGYTQQGSPELSPTLRAGQSRGRRRVRLFGGRRRRGGAGDQFSRAGDRIAKLTNINI